MIWIQTDWHSTDITGKRVEKKNNNKKTDFEKKYHQTTKPGQITS